MAYIIYYDEKGKLRKETSWNNWRDNDIPNEEFKNVPTEGFVLNKKVGGYSGCWGNFRQTYTRVYDPRGFEFEITIPNLLWILECCNCIKGKGLEGKFVYGWDGTELLLIPVDSPDYKEIEEWNTIRHNQKHINKEQLRLGATYLDKTGSECIYMGRYDIYDICYFKDGKKFITKARFENYSKKMGYSMQNRPNVRWRKEYIYDEKRVDTIGKEYVFGIQLDCHGETRYLIRTYKNIKETFVSIIDSDVSPYYQEILKIIESSEKFYPVDKKHYDIIDVTFEEFNRMISGIHDTLVTHKNDDGTLINYIIVQKYQPNEEVCKYILVDMLNEHVLNMFPTTIVTRCYFHNWKKTTIEEMIPVTSEEIYNRLHIVYKQKYLVNGVKHHKEYHWNVSEE